MVKSFSIGSSSISSPNRKKAVRSEARAACLTLFVTRIMARCCFNSGAPPRFLPSKSDRDRNRAHRATGFSAPEPACAPDTGAAAALPKGCAPAHSAGPSFRPTGMRRATLFPRARHMLVARPGGQTKAEGQVFIHGHRQRRRNRKHHSNLAAKHRHIGIINGCAVEQ